MNASNNDYWVLRTLIGKTVDVRARDLNGWQALHHACRSGKADAVKFLIGLGIDPTVTTTDGQTALILATVEGQFDLVTDLLKVKDIRSCITDKDASGFTALHYGVQGGYLDIAKLLLEMKARVNAKDAEGKQALMVACENGKSDCVRLLYKNDAELDGIDKSRRTPLMYACLACHESIALWLVGKRANPNMRDANHETPLDVAEELGMLQIKEAIKLRKIEEQDEEDRREEEDRIAATRRC